MNFDQQNESYISDFDEAGGSEFDSRSMYSQVDDRAAGQSFLGRDYAILKK